MLAPGYLLASELEWSRAAHRGRRKGYIYLGCLLGSVLWKGGEGRLIHQMGISLAVCHILAGKERRVEECKGAIEVNGRKAGGFCRPVRANTSKPETTNHSTAPALTTAVIPLRFLRVCSFASCE